MPVNGRKFEDAIIPYVSIEHYHGGSYGGKLSSSGVSNAIQAQGGVVQSPAKCPHGAPMGACPMCAGKVGGGGGGAETPADKLKRTGMSWAEAYLIWSGIQMAKMGAQQAIEHNHAEALKAENNFINLMNAMGFVDKIRFVQEIMMQSIVNAVQSVNNAVINTVKPLILAVNNTISLVKDSLSNLQAVVEKLAAIIGEEIKNLKDKIIQNFEKIMQKLFDKENLSRLIKVFNQKNKQFFEFLTQKVKSLKEKLSDLLAFVFGISEEERNKKKKKGKQKNAD